MIDVTRSIIIIAICALITFAERALPFLLFRKGKVPPIVGYLGKVLGPAIMTTLVIYCMRNISFSSPSAYIPQLAAAVLTAALYLWKNNAIVSIVSGTVLCMVLTQVLT